MVRWATVDDAQDLAEVHVSSWQRAYDGIFSEDFLSALDRGARAEWWREFIAHGAGVHVAEAGGVVGFCHAATSGEKGWGEIFSLYVHPDHWGEGHGYELLKAGETTLVTRGHERGVLWVLEANTRGRRFYERQGWAPGKPIRIEEIGGAQVTELRYEKVLTIAP